MKLFHVKCSVLGIHKYVNLIKVVLIWDCICFAGVLKCLIDGYMIFGWPNYA